MNRLNIVVPILNEIQESERLNSLVRLFSSHNLIFCDGGSTDGTLNELNKLKIQFPFIRLCTQNIDDPSVLKTIELAYDECTEAYTLIHPLDLDLNSTLEIVELMQLQKVHVFYKKYAPINLLLFIQSCYLNYIDLNLRSNFVWTNALIIKTHILKNFKPDCYGFLEDVQLSDFLKKRYKVEIIKSPIIASSRRYVQSGTFKRFFKNLFIMLMYRTGLLSIKKLKSIYYS